MTHEDLFQKLTQLQQLICQEREYAIQLRVEELKVLQDQKGVLLMELKTHSGPCPEGLKTFANSLRSQNRRNARLLSATLNFLRQTMTSCRRELSSTMYGRHGHQIEVQTMGLLHTGRV